MTVECKNLLNTSSGGDFCDLNVSEAKRILKKLAEATKEYDEPNLKILKRVASAQEKELKESKFDARVDKLEKLVINTVEKIQETAKATAVARQAAEVVPISYDPGAYAYPSPWYPQYPSDEDTAYVDAAGNWYPPRWRDHPNLRYGDPSRPLGYHLQQPQLYQNFPPSLPAPLPTFPQGSQNQGESSPNSPNENQVQVYHAPAPNPPPSVQNLGVSSAPQNQPQPYRPPNMRGNNQGGYPYPRPPRNLEDMMGDLIMNQQQMQNHVQSNQDSVHKIQDAQQEQKASLDQLTRQMSQLATSMKKGGEIRGEFQLKFNNPTVQMSIW